MMVILLGLLMVIPLGLLMMIPLGLVMVIPLGLVTVIPLGLVTVIPLGLFHEFYSGGCNIFFWPSHHHYQHQVNLLFQVPLGTKTVVGITQCFVSK